MRGAGGMNAHRGVRWHHSEDQPISELKGERGESERERKREREREREGEGGGERVRALFRQLDLRFLWEWNSLSAGEPLGLLCLISYPYSLLFSASEYLTFSQHRISACREWKITTTVFRCKTKCVVLWLLKCKPFFFFFWMSILKHLRRDRDVLGWHDHQEAHWWMWIENSPAGGFSELYQLCREGQLDSCDAQS